MSRVTFCRRNPQVLNTAFNRSDKHGGYRGKIFILKLQRQHLRLHQPWLVHLRPGVYGFPKMCHNGFVHMSSVRVDLQRFLVRKAQTRHRQPNPP